MGIKKIDNVFERITKNNQIHEAVLLVGRMQMLTGFFESYLKLTPTEEQVLLEEIKMLSPKEEGEVMELMTSWEKKGLEKGIQKGIEKGLEEGLEKGKMEVARKMLKKGFDEDVIQEMTGLSKEEIKRLMKELQ